jgi:ATP-binding cassette, subfamily B, bacterial
MTGGRVFAAVGSHPFRRLEAAFLRPHRLAAAAAFGCLLLQSLLALPIPLIQGQLLDDLCNGAVEGKPAALTFALALSGACLLGRFILGRVAAITMNRVSLEVIKELTDALHRRLQRVPLSFLDRHQSGGLMARLTSDVGTLLILLNTGTLQLAGDLLLAAGIAAFLVWLNWPLALAALVVVPLAALGQAAFRGPLYRRSENTREQFTAMFALLAERLPAVRLVKAFGQERAELARFETSLGSHAGACSRGLRLSTLQAAAALMIAGLGTAAVVTGGAWLIAAGRLTPGGMFTFYALSALLYAPIVRLAQFQAGLAATRVAIERMLALLDEPVSNREPGPLRISTHGTLTMNGVSFRYRNDGPVILDDISFRVEPGRVLGIVGPSSAGKSTLLALLANLYRADSGTVALDGVDVGAWPHEDFHRSVALVPQRPILFEGTIRSNLCYAAPGTHEHRLWQVLDAVELSGLVRSRPQGLDAPLGPGGSGLSGGQRQRLALARAVLPQPKVLLLDDCTSALDSATESRVWVNLAALLPGVTRVIVSHKAAVVHAVDEILVLNAGRVVERGSHERLLAASEWYSRGAGGYLNGTSRAGRIVGHQQGDEDGQPEQAETGGEPGSARAAR